MIRLRVGKEKKLEQSRSYLRRGGKRKSRAGKYRKPSGELCSVFSTPKETTYYFLFFPRPSGNRHLTVFNDQAEIQVGGMWKTNGGGGHVYRPFVGVIAGVLYNGVRPLDFHASTTMASSSGGSDSKGSSQAHGDIR